MKLAVIADKRLAVAEKMSEHPTIGKAYTRQAEEILYSAGLVHTPKTNFYAIQKEMPKDMRMSDAAEEFDLQKPLEEAFMKGYVNLDPRKAAVFDDLFARNPEKIYGWQWTLTGLRVPKRSKPNYDPSTPDFVDGQGKKYWVRMLLIGDKEVGEVLVPEGNWRVVIKWDEVTGLPLITSDKESGMGYEKHTTHFLFNPNPDPDNNSGHKDVAVGRGGHWVRGERERCLGVAADCKRSDSVLYGGFRPVQGSLVLPTVDEIEKVV